MQTEVERIKEALAAQFSKTVRVSPAQMARTEFKVNVDSLYPTDLDLLQRLRGADNCYIEIKRSGAGLLVIVIY